jgi:hypothetical protein
MGISSFADIDTHNGKKYLFHYIDNDTQVSVFPNTYLSRTDQIESKHLPEIWKASIDSFKQVIIKRKNYLDKLPSLSEGWISGEGKAPTASSTEIAKHLLSCIANNAQWFKGLPKIVMGPLPSGGVAIEFHKDEDNALFISISDDGCIELDVEKNGYFFETITSYQNLFSSVIEKYGAISR